jgi:hypothetical protein
VADKTPKITLYMGKDTQVYKDKLDAIGAKLLADGVDVKDNLRGGISQSAVMRYLIDEEVKRRKIEES